MSNKDIKRATIGRLPQYLRYITALPQEITTVSATGIAKALELGEVEGAMASLSLVITALLTVVIAPFLGNFI